MIDQQFVDRSRQFLTATYLPKIEAAVAQLSDDEIWWRPNPASNAIGHLLLHLAGNVRQWIVSGLGGTPASRQRHLEFAPEDTAAKANLLADLSRAVAEADAVLARLNLATLETRVEIQGFNVTRFGALYHAVEHFAMHTGQIIWIAKARTGRDLGFYEVEGDVARPRWPGQTGDP